MNKNSGGRGAAGLVLAIIVGWLVLHGIGGAVGALIGTLLKAAMLIGALLAAALIAIVVMVIKSSKSGGETEVPQRAKEITEPDQLETVLKELKNDGTIGELAAGALEQCMRMKRQQERYEKVTADRFGRDSLTYQKYMTAAVSTRETLNASFLKLVKTLQTFDSREYRLLRSGIYKTDAIPDDIQEEKLAADEKLLAELRDMLSENERVMMKLDELMTKIADTGEIDNSVTEEIEELTQQLKYYRQAGGEL